MSEKPKEYYSEKPEDVKEVDHHELERKPDETEVEWIKRIAKLQEDKEK